MMDALLGGGILAAQAISLVIITSGVLQNAVQLIQFSVAARSLSRDKPVESAALLWRRYGNLVPPVAILAPAYNEELTVVQSVRTMLALRYPRYEIIVINDGSSDNTLNRLIEAFALEPSVRAHETVLHHAPIRAVYTSRDFPSLVVIDKKNGGKADALNAGISLARAPVFCAIDADTLLEPDALLRAVRPMIEDPARVIAVGGSIRIANGCRFEGGRITEIGLPRNLLALFQTVEYLRAFLVARLAWSKAGALTIISGAFGVFRRGLVIEAGGYRTDLVGEDMELVVRLHHHMQRSGKAYRIAYLPEPLAFTEVPETLRALASQRARWQRGALESYFAHKSMTLNPRYGRVGLLGLLHMLLVYVVGPPLEVCGYILIPLLWLGGFLSLPWFLAFLAVTFAFGVAISVATLLLAERQLRRFPKISQLALLLAVAVLENFGYRQLNTIWRLKGWWQFARKRGEWGTMTRKGFAPSSPDRKSK